jgi:hypothetical protein
VQASCIAQDVRCRLALAIALLSAACSSGPTARAASDALANVPPEARRLRDAALVSARVWAPPRVPIGEADLASNTGDDPRFSPDAELQCRFTLDPVGGTTSKFYCELPDGEHVKVKYGSANPELPAEVAASRLLATLGFPADRMFIVRGVSCAGCPRFPFQALRCYQNVGWETGCFTGGIDPTETVTFTLAVVERRLEGRVVESFEDEGWAWFELDRLDPGRGGSSRTQVDAFRLMARFLAHWDNKSQNQRLICPPSQERSDGSCASPLAIMQDLGATFGPLKIDLHNWRRDRIWKDAATCTISMAHMPWGGGTFPEIRISEDGRQMLAELLGQLSIAQLRGLFDGARVTSHDQVTAAGRSADAWISTFLDKVDQITSAGPCPQ